MAVMPSSRRRAPGCAWRGGAGLCVARGRRAVRGAGAPGFAGRGCAGLCVARGRRAVRGAGAPGSVWRGCAGLCGAQGRRALHGAGAPGFAWRVCAGLCGARVRRAVRGAGAPGCAWRGGAGLCVVRGRRALCGAGAPGTEFLKKPPRKERLYKKTRGMGKLEFKFSYHTAFYGAAKLFVNTYKLIAAAAQTNFFSVFKGMDTVSRFDTLP